MAILTAACDDCSIGLGADEIYSDYDHGHRCHGCQLKKDLFYAEQDWESFKEWLDDTYLKTLEEKKVEVNRIKKELENLNA